MNLTIIQSLIMGFASGLAEMLPISAEAHRGLLRTLFGVESEGALFTLSVHIACLAVVWWKYRGEINILRDAKKQMRLPARHRTHHPRLSAINTIRLLRSAVVILVIFKLITPFLSGVADRLWLLAAMLAVNGVILLLPSLMRSGNKDSRNMLRVDGMLMALGAGLSVVPGISPVGACACAGMIRGVDRRYALRFAYLLLMAGLGIGVGFDILALIAGGAALSASAFFTALAGGACAAVGSWLGLKLTHNAVNSGWFSHFCYYSWGMALLCLILYLYI